MTGFNGLAVDMGEYQTAARMAAKRHAVPLPDLAGRAVLDVGCDHGYWSFLAAGLGAGPVLGLDRNRVVRGKGPLNLVAINRERARSDFRYRACRFEQVDLGRQWHEFGLFDVVLCLSVYHHIYENCGDHRAVWTWLAQHTVSGGVVLWEGPVDDTDSVVQRNVSNANRPGYSRAAILAAAAPWFAAERIGPALHEPTREVWRFTRVAAAPLSWTATLKPGAGGAAPAFEHAGGRRIRELAAVLGWPPHPGSLNLALDRPFAWDRGYVRAQLLDVVDRKAGLGSPWAPRWARLYPVTIAGHPAHALRFEGERYPETFVELIAPVRLRDLVQEGTACLAPQF